MVKSLAWRIQLWHALMMLLVIGGLGTFLYLRIEHAEFDRVDTELQSAGRLIVESLRSVSLPDLERGDFVLPALASGRRLLPPADRPALPPGHLPPQRRRPRPPERHGDAYIIWDKNGDILQSSENAPDVTLVDVPDMTETEVAHIRPRFQWRDAFLRGPHGSVVMVSHSMHREMATLLHWRWLIMGSGGGALLAGLVGGAWLTRRALRPLQMMSDTAASITADNLSGRIDTKAIDKELVVLAQTLNATFDRLEADIQKKTRFAADASHELRTPLTVILGYLEFTLKQPNVDCATRETLEACHRAARRMKSLIEQLLLLARADAGKLEPDQQTFDLSAAVEECVDLLAPLARQKNISLQASLPAAEVLGDPKLLSQAVINLITNAIQHNAPGGSVQVSIVQEKNDLILSVVDTGEGIALAAQPHIFERFYRADAARSRETGGTGLGLAISQSIAKAHGGEIRFESKEGHGTSFTLRLPVATTPSPPKAL